MASGYPGSLDAFSTGHVLGEVIQAGTDNDQADAINKVEAELGTDPSGVYATVKARLDALAVKPATGFVQHLSSAGNDSSDGLSWGSPKLTWAAAIAAFPSTGGDLYVTGSFDVTSGVTIDGSSAKINVYCEPGTVLRATGSLTNLFTYAKVTDRPGIGVFGLILDMNGLASVGFRLINSWATDHRLRVINVGGGTAVKLTTDDANFGVYYNRMYAQVRGEVTGSTATTSSGSPNLTLVAPTGGWANGMTVTGTGIPANTTISSGAGTATMVMSQNATASASGVAITGVRGTGSVGVLVEGQSAGNAANDNAVSAHCTNLATGIKQGANCDTNMYRDSDATLNGIGYDITSGYALLSSVHEEGTITNEGIVVRTGAVAQAEALYFEQGDVEGTGLLIMRYRGNVATTFGGTSSPNIDTSFSNTGNWGLVERHETASGARVWSLDGTEVMRLNRNGTWTWPNAVAAGSVANNTLFRDPATGLLAYKGNTGGVTSFESRGLKAPVRVASVANVTLTAPGATIDGVAMVSGDRMLLKDQTAAAANGVYVWNGAASTATRAPDSDTAVKLTDSLLVTVDEGTINADTVWSLSTPKPITLETTALRFGRLMPGYNFATRDPWSHGGNAIAATMDRNDVTNLIAQTAITAICSFHGGMVVPAGRLITNINAFCTAAGSGAVTLFWWALVRQSDRVVLQRTANSTTLPTVDAVHTRALQATLTLDYDTPCYIALATQVATTSPSFAGVTGLATSNFAAPILTGNSSTTPTATPPTVGAVLGAPAAGNTGRIHCWLS